MLLFDIAMELADFENAYEYLGRIKNNSDFNYLIRLSKWSDHQGNLVAAIRYLEKAKEIAESGASESLKLWAYTNLATYYAHDTRVDDAYRYYLKALKLQPENAFAKEGIAWIAYVSEKNTTEAN